MSRGIALVFLDGPWTASDTEARAERALGGRHGFVRGLVKRLRARFPDPPRDLSDLEEAIWRDGRWKAAVARTKRRIVVRSWRTPPVPPPERPPWLRVELPELRTVGDVADWLGLASTQLDWMVDLRRMNRRAVDPRLRHYHHRWVPKRSGAWRLLEAPKPRLKRIQRRVLDELLSRVPPHDDAHGFRRGRSIVTFAAAHVGHRVVVRLDLEDFFAEITEARVRGLFETLGYSRPVARVLAGLCCVPAPHDVLRSRPRCAGPRASEERFAQVSRLAASHLPQGAPTSPALSNLLAFRLDARLAGLARAWDGAYTRYADDLAFSGGRRLARSPEALVTVVAAVASEEGFRVRLRKTRVMRSGVRQQLGGVVVNARPSLPRRERELLEAILTNCVRRGPSTQNRAGRPDFRAHLEGSVGWAQMVDPARGAKLRALLDAIDWSA